MQSAEEVVQSIRCGYHDAAGFENRDYDNQAASLIRARDREIARDAFEAGYAQGHNDTVESCVRNMGAASEDYLRDLG